MPFRFKKFNGPSEHIPGMNKVKSLLRSANLTYTSKEDSKFFVWGTALISWETDEVPSILSTKNIYNIDYP